MLQRENKNKAATGKYRPGSRSIEMFNASKELEEKKKSTDLDRNPGNNSVNQNETQDFIDNVLLRDSIAYESTTK